MGERGLLGLGGISEVSDSPHSSIVTSSEDDTLTLPAGAVGSEEGNVGGLEDVRGDSINLTREFFGLTGEGGVVDLHLIGLKENEIGRDEVTTIDDYDITWN